MGGLAHPARQPHEVLGRLYLRRTSQTQTEIDSIQQNLTATRISLIDIKNPALFLNILVDTASHKLYYVN
jgi:hypothetical protein